MLKQSNGAFVSTLSIKKFNQGDEQNRESLNGDRGEMKLHFQEDKICFIYNGGHANMLYNRDLRLKNESISQVIHFKIKCSNPMRYRVRPSEDTVDPGKTMEVSIQLLMDPTSNLDANYFLKFESDKFLLEWWFARKSEKSFFQDSTGHYRKIMPVHVEFKQQENMTERIKEGSHKKRNAILLELIEKNEVEINIIKTKIAILEQNKPGQSWVTLFRAVIFGIIFFGLGVALAP